MIVFDKLWTVMQAQDVSTYQLREKCGIDSKTIRRLRANENMETKTLNKLCAALHCGLGTLRSMSPMKIFKKSSVVPVGKGRHFCVTVPVWAVLFPAPAPAVPILKSYPRCGVRSGR